MILKQVYKNFPDLGIIWRRGIFGNPFAYEPGDSPFNDGIAAEKLECAERRQYIHSDDSLRRVSVMGLPEEGPL